MTPRRRPQGVAEDSIFPLPLPLAVSPVRNPKRKGQHTAQVLTHLWVAFMNVAYAGLDRPHVCRWVPSAAQSRCLGSLHERAQTFLAETPREVLGGELRIRNFLRLVGSDYEANAEVLPLGVRAGVPARAAQVDTLQVLSEDYPSLALKCRDPSALLREPLTFEEQPGPPFAHLHSSYPELIKKGVAADLFGLRQREEIPVVEGKRVYVLRRLQCPQGRPRGPHDLAFGGGELAR